MRAAQGYAIIVDPDRPPVEFDTISCAHCNGIVHVGPRQDPSDLGGFCRCCMKHTCAKCADNGCTPFLRKLEEYERRQKLLLAVGV